MATQTDRDGFSRQLVDGGDARNHGRARRLGLYEETRGKDLYMRENKNLLTQLLAAGEFPILANTYLDTFMRIQKSGTPIEWVPGRNPIPASTHLLGIYAHARHPNAAK